MKYLAAALLAATALVACSNPTRADALNNLFVVPLSDAQVVPQSASDPCIICATTQAHNPVGFGYNNFNSTGNDSSFNLFSSNTTGAFGNGDATTVTAYTGTQLQNLLIALGDAGLTFGVAIDVNSTSAKSEVLTEFRLIDLDKIGTGALGSAIIFDLAGTYALPDIRNGNGSADYLITGFNLADAFASGAISPGDRLLFQATWDHAVDGGESFYIVPFAAVPGPVVGAGLPGAIAGVLMLLGLARRRRQAASV